MTWTRPNEFMFTVLPFKATASKLPACSLSIQLADQRQFAIKITLSRIYPFFLIGFLEFTVVFPMYFPINGGLEFFN